MKRTRVLVQGVLIVAMLISMGCLGHRRALREAREAGPKEGWPEGVWEGRWYSGERPEHGGETTWVLTRSGEMLYELSSQSRFWRVFTGTYGSSLVVTPTAPGEFLLRGGEALWLFGSYSITGKITGSELRAEYRLGKEVGMVELKRVGGEAGD